MHLPLEMHDYTWAQLLKDNPEWASLCATVLFAIITTVIIWRQKCVMEAQVKIMKWQAKNSVRHETQQNKLLEAQNRLIEMQNRVFRFQFEYSRLNEINHERRELLKMAQQIYEDASFVVGDAPHSPTEAKDYARLRESAGELDFRLKTLNVPVRGREGEVWFDLLATYLTEVMKTLLLDVNQHPSAETKKRLKSANEFFTGKYVTNAIESAIVLESNSLHKIWDKLTQP